jgi:hypothetical protein
VYFVSFAKHPVGCGDRSFFRRLTVGYRIESILTKAEGEFKKHFVAG